MIVEATPATYQGKINLNQTKKAKGSDQICFSFYRKWLSAKQKSLESQCGKSDTFMQCIYDQIKEKVRTNFLNLLDNKANLNFQPMKFFQVCPALKPNKNWTTSFDTL